MKLRHTVLLCALCAAANAIYVPDYLKLVLPGVPRQLVAEATDDYGRPKPHQDPHQLGPDVEASEIAAKLSVSAGPKSSNKSKTSTQKGNAAGTYPALPLAAPLVALLLL